MATTGKPATGSDPSGPGAGGDLPLQTVRAGRTWPSRQAVLGWCLVAGLIVLQFVLFRRHVLREVAWAYPDHYDQAYYLHQLYTLHERMRAVGCWHALVEHLATPRPQGILFPVPGALLCLLVGSSRLAALSANFAHFALLQAVLAATLRWLTRRWSVPLLGLGLLLAAAAPFLDNGGLLDYRIDFAACCLFGVVLCLVVRSGLFASRRWSVAVGAACSWLALSRFLTMAYLGGIAVLVLLFLLVRRWRRRNDPVLRRHANRQLVGLALAGALLLGATGPALWNSRQAIYGYYVVGHITGAEKHIRSLGANVTTAEQLLYYPRTVYTQHLGTTFVVLAAVSLGACAGLGLLQRFTRSPAGSSGRFDWTGVGFFLAGCLAVPYGLLTLDEAKSSIPANVLVPAALWLLLLVPAAVSRAFSGGPGTLPRRVAFTALAVVVLAWGMSAQAGHYREHRFFTKHRPDVENVTRIFDLLEQYCRRTNCRTPRVAVTSIQADYLAPIIIPALVYERHGVLINPAVGKVGGTIFPVTAAEALQDLRQSDFVILADPTRLRSPYPFDQSMKELFPQLKRFCDESLVPLQHFRVFRQDVFLYVRPVGEGRDDLGGM
jgi:hypothetical protein